MHWIDRWKPELNAALCARLIAFVYFIAFTSWGVQAAGLIGSHGILPAAQFFQAASRAIRKLGVLACAVALLA